MVPAYYGSPCSLGKLCTTMDDNRPIPPTQKARHHHDSTIVDILDFPSPQSYTPKFTPCTHTTACHARQVPPSHSPCQETPHERLAFPWPARQDGKGPQCPWCPPDFAEIPNHPSGCCCSIPLWNNPYITFRIPTSSTHALQHIATYPQLRTIGDLAQLRFNLSCRQQPDALTNRQAMKHTVKLMCLVIPHKWGDSIPTPTS